MSGLFQMFSYDFMLRALIVGGLVSLCAALLGVNLVLKRYSMIGDGLSHVGFGALAIALVLNLSPLRISIPIVAVAAVLLLRVSENSKIKGDAAIAMISSSALAIGIMLTSASSGINIDINAYMFGSILAMNGSDVYLSVIISVLVLLLYILFYHRIFAVTFDETFARATGVKAGRYNLLLAVLTAVTVVIGMRLMGTLLISSLLIFPAVSAMRLFKSFRQVVICAAISSVICFLIGLMISFQFSQPAGASVVVTNLAGFLIFSVIGTLKNR